MRLFLMGNLNLENLANGKFHPKRKQRSISAGTGIQFLNGLSGNCLIQFFPASFAPQFPRDLDTKKTPPNMEVRSESLIAMLELLMLLYIERSITFLIGRKHTVNFRNQRPCRHICRLYNNHVKDTQGHG